MAKASCMWARYWLYQRETQRARLHFYEASRMLVLSCRLSMLRPSDGP